MAELKLRRRNRLRRKEIESLAALLNDNMGCETFSSSDHVETAEAGEYKLAIIGGRPMVMFFDDMPFLTIQGLLEYNATKGHVTVDMGAVKFLANGADVMAPGIVDAHPDIKKGMPVWVRDQKNKRALAIGLALMDSAEMIGSDSGKAVKTVHYVGDKIWDLGN